VTRVRKGQKKAEQGLHFAFSIGFFSLTSFGWRLFLGGNGGGGSLAALVFLGEKKIFCLIPMEDMMTHLNVSAD